MQLRQFSGLNETSLELSELKEVRVAKPLWQAVECHVSSRADWSMEIVMGVMQDLSNW